MPAVADEIDRLLLAARVKQMARDLGFDLVGIAPAGPSAYRDFFRRWLDDGMAGEMHYLHRRFDERTDPATYLPGARSVICVAINYHVPLLEPTDEGPHGRIARYALGDDYHGFLKQRLYDLADWLRDEVPGIRTRCGTDSAPIAERELAARAGIGWIGKNCCVIHPRVGSWLLLGEVVTTLDLPADVPIDDHCGSCTRCLDACPTGALTAPRTLDARRCISYLTIEQGQADITPDLQAKMGNWLAGCDICQDVCPHNRRPPMATAPELQPKLPTGTLPLQDAIGWTPADFSAHLRHTAIRRVKLPVLQRNARIALANS